MRIVRFTATRGRRAEEGAESKNGFLFDAGGSQSPEGHVVHRPQSPFRLIERATKCEFLRACTLRDVAVLSSHITHIATRWHSDSR